MEDSGPHGDFTANTSTCTTCHGSHSENGLDTASAGSSNDFCLNCHNGARAKAVSTHSNLSPLVAGVKQEQDFELLCIQCHDPHNATANIFAIRTNLVMGSLPTRFHSMVTQTGPVNFTNLNPSSQNEICTSCHADPLNPGYPMTAHEGGDIHNFLGDMTDQSCISCHYHDYDGNPATKDGFMPLNAQIVSGAQGSPTPTTTAVPATTQITTPGISETATPSPTTNPQSTSSPTP
jgi:predicted CXXCH cytochrome family protein